jgi:hypothetical protein
MVGKTYGFISHIKATALTVVGSGPTEDGRFLWAIKVHSVHFLRRGSKAVGPMS